jgi:predicted metal-dependent hydrolase
MKNEERMLYTQQFRPENLELIVRRVDYDYFPPIKENKYWLEDSPVMTHFFNAFQSTFPEGEKLFIQAALDGVSILLKKGKIDKQFRIDLSNFMHQEASHSQQHKKWTRALVQLGYRDLKSYDDQLKHFRIFSRKYFPTILRLSITAAAEHYTASLAYLFTHIRPKMLIHFPLEFKGLLLYHAMEEIEHKSVCFDLYQNVSGSYIIRMVGFLFVTIDLIYNVYVRIKYLLKKDGNFRLKVRLTLLNFIFGRNGVVKGLLFRVKEFLKPSFHPWKTDERAFINKFFQKYQSEMNIIPFKI